MPGYVLHEGVTISCPHGGSATLTASNTRVTVGGRRVAAIGDPTTVAGCGFSVSGAPSPCLQVQWSAPAAQVRVGAAALLSSSVGLCVNAGGAPQGPATVSGYQTKVRGR
jgi:hypothetical protein